MKIERPSSPARKTIHEFSVSLYNTAGTEEYYERVAMQSSRRRNCDIDYRFRLMGHCNIIFNGYIVQHCIWVSKDYEEIVRGAPKNVLKLSALTRTTSLPYDGSSNRFCSQKSSTHPAMS